MDTSRSYLEPSSFSKKIAAAIIIVVHSYYFNSYILDGNDQFQKCR